MAVRYEGHLENVSRAREVAAKANRERYLRRIEDYTLNPKLCEGCEKPLSYNHRGNRFCCKSCSCTFNNLKKESPTEEHKEKTRLSMLAHCQSNFELTGKGHSHGNGKNYTSIFLHECKVCHRKKYVQYQIRDRATCGNLECVIEAIFKDRTYQNGSRKSIPYFSIFENKEVILESSWEVLIAEWLDSKEIDWFRPKKMDWFDSKGKRRFYYSDFYLPKFDVYLDPKNPYCMEKDREKLKWFSDKISLFVGNPKEIIEKVEKLISAWVIG